MTPPTKKRRTGPRPRLPSEKAGKAPAPPGEFDVTEAHAARASEPQQGKKAYMPARPPAARSQRGSSLRRRRPADGNGKRSGPTK